MNPNPAQFGGSFQQPPQQPKGCLGRNWKWLLPVGCLGLILAGVLLVGGIFFVAMSAIKSSEVYQGALKVAQTHPTAIERLGSPITDGWFVRGNVRFESGSGSADFAIPLSGSERSGRLYVRAVNDGGAWMYERLDLVTSTGLTFSLLDRNVVQSPPGSTIDVEEDADGSSEGAADDTGEETTAPGDDAETADTPSGVKTISGGVLNGKATSLPQPAYPALAKAARAKGTVVVKVTVDETGNVVSASAVSGHPLLHAAAVQAAKQAKFTPTLLSGKPVRVSGLLSYNFVLEQ